MKETTGREIQIDSVHLHTVMAFQSSPKVTFVFRFTSIREKVGVDALKSRFVHRSRRAFLRVKKCYRNNFFLPLKTLKKKKDSRKWSRVTKGSEK
jgi:hypothetical protein